MNQTYVSILSKWKREKEIVLTMNIDLGTDIKPFLEKEN